MTGIDYLDEVWNPITGCSGKGCKAHCWARDMVKRFPVIHEHERLEYPGVGVPFEEVQFHHDRVDKPLHWRKPRRVGVCFMGDLFDNQVKISWLNMVFNIMTSSWEKALGHEFFVLTKRIKNMARYVLEHIYCETAICAYENSNIHLGVSITDQEDADRMIPELLRVPGKRWVSVEPMLGPIDFRDETQSSEAPWLEGLDWIILGCESGPKRRPCPHEWMIDVVRQCKDAGLPVWVKQVDMGKRVSHNWVEWPDGLRVRERG